MEYYCIFIVESKDLKKKKKKRKKKRKKKKKALLPLTAATSFKIVNAQNIPHPKPSGHAQIDLWDLRAAMDKSAQQRR